MANLVNLESVTHGFGTRILLDNISTGIAAGEVIGVVGRNGDGKTTLLRILTGELEPDQGRVTISGSTSIGVLTQEHVGHPDESVRDVILNGEPDHVWAADTQRRGLVESLLAGIDLDRLIGTLSGGGSKFVSTASIFRRSSSVSPIPMIPPQQTLIPAFCTWPMVLSRS